MSTPQWRSVTSNIDRTALSASLAMVAANLLWPTLVMDIAPYLLLAGMVFPGIPHGAVDNLLDLEPESRQNIMIFLTRYVSLMVAMLLIWLVSPSNGLALFILYSGWHFGESDLRRLGGFRSFPALISGTTLLLAMLCSHPQEIRSYLLAFGIPAESVADRTFWYTAAASFLIFLLNGLRSAGINRMKLLLLAATLAAGVFTPLLVAFGIYFVFVHSRTGWQDIRNGLNLTDRKLIWRALPFTIGGLLFLGGAVVLLKDAQQLDTAHMAIFFIALSCLSAPHVLFMSRFYDNSIKV